MWTEMSKTGYSTECSAHQTYGHLRSQSDGMLAQGECDITGEVQDEDGVYTLPEMLPET